MYLHVTRVFNVKSAKARLRGICCFVCACTVLYSYSIHAEDTVVQSLLSPEEIKYLSENPKITLGVGASFDPFVIQNKDGTFSGHDIQIAELISNHTGIQIDYEMDTWKDIQVRAESKDIDGLLTAIFTDERAEYFVPSDSYLSMTSLVLVRKGNPKQINSPSDIAGKRVAMQRGNVLFEKILNDITDDVNVIYFDHIYELVTAVVGGRADLSILDETAPYVAKKTGLIDYIEVAFPVGEPMGLHFLLRKDQPELQSIINKGLASIRAEDKIKIRDQWFGMPQEPVDWPLIIKISLLTAVVFSVLIYWSLTLRAARRKAEFALAELAQKDEELEAANRVLAELSVTDHLTHIYNREKLDAVLDKELLRASRYESGLGLIMIDVDLFKQVNDTYGHQVGDNVLIDISRLLNLNIRRIDTLGRWGGEEFLIICPGIGRSGLIAMAEKLRAEVDEFKFPVVGHKTASFGVAIYKQGDTSEQIISRADKALYNSKEMGRNRVTEG